MSIALIITDRDLTNLSKGIQDKLPEVAIQCWPNIVCPEDIEFAVAWKQPEQIWENMPNLKVVSSLGAGVDGLTSDKFLPENVSITRIIDKRLADEMAEYVLTAIYMLKCQFNVYQKQQSQNQWQMHRRNKGVNVTILGVGRIGKVVADKLLINGFNVTGWGRSEVIDHPFPYFFGEENLANALVDADYVVSILPNTPQTHHIIDERLISYLSPKASIINVGRGSAVDEKAIVEALDKGDLKNAVLDVFQQEPLDVKHPFWTHDKIIITPHISAITDRMSVMEQIAENYTRYKKKLPLKNLVDRQKGY